MHRTRRRVLGAVGTTLATALAGCRDRGAAVDGGEERPGGTVPAIDEWLTTTAVGAAADTYDGTLVDNTGTDPVRVDVGAEGNGGYYAFDPVAMVVSVGTTVRWVWSGRGEAHNVTSLPDEQLGESDYELSSGEPTDETGFTFDWSPGAAGVLNYHCETHLSLGMKGGIAVE